MNNFTGFTTECLKDMIKHAEESGELYQSNYRKDEVKQIDSETFYEELFGLTFPAFAGRMFYYLIGSLDTKRLTEQASHIVWVKACISEWMERNKGYKSCEEWNTSFVDHRKLAKEALRLFERDSEIKPAFKVEFQKFLGLQDLK